MLAWWKLTVLLGLMFLAQASVAFYLHPVSPTTCSASRTAVKLPTTTKRGHSLPHLSATFATTSSTSTVTSTDNAPQQQQQQQQQATKLLNLLVQNYRLDKPPSDATRRVIADSITRLAQAQVSFDPVDCFNGPLFAVLHQQGPTQPLWETIGLSLWNNIKGQKYTYLSETQDYEVTNYAEIAGSGLFIQVEGTAQERKTPSLTENDNDNNTSSGTTNSNATPFDFWKGLSNLFPQSSQQPQSSQPRMLQCPCDIVATVNGGGLYLGGQKIVDLPMIQGTGVVRVLYADPQMRILESPHQDNTGWEDQGLIVVQVRQDLLQLDATSK